MRMISGPERQTPRNVVAHVPHDENDSHVGQVLVG
jgi:hypothetical protein